MLVVTKDVLTPRMAGPAIRAWHIADTLAGDHDVHLATLSPLCTLSGQPFSASAADEHALVELEAWCEILVVQGFVLVQSPVLRASDKLMVVDLYDPLQLETLEATKTYELVRRRHELALALDTLSGQLGRGDFFVCASAKQRDFWLGQLSAVGRINPHTYDQDPTLRMLVDIAPFGLPERDPIHRRGVLRGVIPGIEEDAEILVWAGGIYNWFDPLTLISAVDKLRHERPKIRLFFMGLSHPNPEVPAMEMSFAAQALADELSLTDRHVFFNQSWVDYEDRQDYLLEADIGVSMHFEHAETAFSFRTRMLDYLWCRLPMVATEGDGFADLIEREGLGYVVAPRDVDSVSDGLRALLENQAQAAACRANIDRVRAHCRWSETLAPLTRFCAQPYRAPDRLDAKPTVVRPIPNTVRNLRPLPRWIAADARAVGRRLRARYRRARAVWLPGTWTDENRF